MIGERLGNWVIYKELGQGGMGHVYLAQEEMTGRRAAIKVLAAELAQEKGFLQRFRQEIDALRKLDHPNIVHFLESGFENGMHYYVMEYVEGESLERVLERKKRLPWRDVLDIAFQICAALKHAHDHGIIHRDLKPSNLLQTAENVIKLTDFGIAKVFAGTHLTATGSVVGTAEYISPEQASGKPVTKRSDLYALGVVLYVLLTGRPPFTGKGPMDLLYKHQFAQFDAPQRLVIDLPYEINDVVCQLLEKDPQKRPPDCLVLSRQLQKILDKLDRKSQQTAEWTPGGRTVADASSGEDDEDEPHGEGPATLMSRLVRSELKRQQQGGPVAQFFNHPVVLVLGLLLCIGGIAYALWPPSAETLFQRGSALMQTGNVSDMETAFSSYFDPLQDLPDHPYQEKIEEYRDQLERARQRRDHPVPSVVEPLFQRALRLRQEGKLKEAKQILSNIAQVFDGVSSEKSWVERARKELKKLDKNQAGDDRWRPVREALQHAKKLATEGKQKEAERICDGIEQLYGDNAEVKALVDEARKKMKH